LPRKAYRFRYRLTVYAGYKFVATFSAVGMGVKAYTQDDLYAKIYGTAMALTTQWHYHNGPTPNCLNGLL